MTYQMLWGIHAVLMTTSFLSLLTGIILSHVFRQKKWRFKTHKGLGLYAGIAGAAALLTALIMVQIFKGIHFTSPHAIAGGAVGLLLLLTPIIGQRIQKGKRKKRMKKIHKPLGYGLSILMALTMLSGMIFIGMISLPS